MPLVAELRPVLLPKPWGGSRAVELMGLDATVPTEPVGEVLCAHPDCVVEDDGRTLAEFAAAHGIVTAPGGAELCVTVIDAREPLSVQVHPSPASGADCTEAWVLLEVTPGARLEFGHRAADDALLKGAVRAGDWRCLVHRTPRAGDAVVVPGGTVHAIGAGMLVYEVSRADSPTYRLHDYGRRDAEGRERPLHLDAGLAAAVAPSPVWDPSPAPPATPDTPLLRVATPLFEVWELHVRDRAELPRCGLLYVTCVEGEGLVAGREVRRGQTLLVQLDADGAPCPVQGSLDLLVAVPRPTS